MEDSHDIVGTWRFHSEMTLKLLDQVDDVALLATGAVGGRTVAALFAHVHMARRMWLDASAPDLLAGIDKIPTRSKADLAAITRAELRDQLTRSAEAIAVLLERSLDAGRVKNFKGSPARFSGYLMSHEAYHWAEIGIVCHEAGYPLDKDDQQALWAWW